jgi:tetratricopeptide (TPR) repeat protein
VRPAALILAVLFSSVALNAQVRATPGQSAMIEGEVHFANGNPARFSYLSLLSENGGGMVQSATTDSAGYYAFSGVSVGTNYTISIQMQGYERVQRFVMVTGYMTEENFTLVPVGAGAEPHMGAVVSVQHLEIPPKALAQYVEGVRLMDAGNNKAAEARFREAVRIYPDYAASFRRLGAVEANLGRFPDAHKDIERALGIEKNTSLNYAYLGYVCMKEQQLDKAEQAFRKSIGISNNDWLAQLELGRIEYNRKDYQGAYPHLALAHQIHPELRSVHLLLYDDLIRLNKRQEALDELDHFLKLFPKSPEAPRLRKVRATLEAAISRQKN